MNWWRWRERNLIIDSSHWSKFLVFFFFRSGNRHVLRIYTVRRCMQPKRRVRKRPSKPSETLRVWRRKSCHLESTRPGVCQPNPTRWWTLWWFRGVFRKRTYIYNKYIRCIPLREGWYLRCSHASALSLRFEKGRCKSFEACRSAKNHQCLGTILATTNGTYQALCPIWTHLDHW